LGLAANLWQGGHHGRFYADRDFNLSRQ